MTVYHIDLKVAATAYVKADSKEEAIKLLKDAICFPRGCDLDDLEISSVSFDDPDLPEVSLSPAMSIEGPYGDWDDMEEAE